MKTTRKVLIKDKPIECEIEYDIVDNGIGAYEFWGMRGHDTQLGVEVCDIIPKDGSTITDEEFETLAEQVERAMEDEGEVHNYISSQEDVRDQAWEGGFADNH